MHICAQMPPYLVQTKGHNKNQITERYFWAFGHHTSLRTKGTNKRVPQCEGLGNFTSTQQHPKYLNRSGSNNGQIRVDNYPPIDNPSGSCIRDLILWTSFTDLPGTRGKLPQLYPLKGPSTVPKEAQPTN